MASTWSVQAADLIRSLAQQCNQSRGFGSMSPSIYDTAWVSMIQNRGHEFEWLFPQCFDCLLETQLPDGSWESYASPIDGILNTAAALLSLRKHLKDPAAATADLAVRISRAEAALRKMLIDWDIDSCDHVGFEVLVTSHLDYLDAEGTSIDLPVRSRLKALQQAKLAKLAPSYVETKPSTLIHSLEALVGIVNFDRLHHLRADGSMLASPSSTAAYLMNSSNWDHEAEAYLHAALGRPRTNSGGGLLPCAWPTTLFELSWVVTALIDGGFALPHLGQSEMDRIGHLLEETFVKQHAIVGFTYFGLPDADDTARTTLALLSLGRKVDPSAMIAAFEGCNHFLTYKGERNPSFSTNCNVAAALLAQQSPSQYLDQIQKCIQFLVTFAFENEITDKWNISRVYPKMLISQTILRFLTRLDDGSLNPESFSNDLLHQKIPIVCMQTLAQLLDSQDANGSWDCKHEVTAYAITALVALSSLPWVQPLLLSIDIALNRGKRYLEQHQHRWSHGDYLWIEKVTYSSSNLSLAYCLGAVNAKPSSRTWGHTVQSLNNVRMKRLSTMGMFFSRLPLFGTTPVEYIHTAFIQGHYFKGLQQLRAEIFPTKPKKDDYLEYVPLTWTACNIQAGGVLKPTLLQEMMTISVLMYEADEFMETAVEQRLSSNLGDVRRLISNLCLSVQASSNSQNGHGSNGANGSHKGPKTNGIDHVYHSEYVQKSEGDLGDVERVLRKFKSYMLNHPAVLRSPLRLQEVLLHEFKTFLLAHLTHAEDNQRIAVEQQVLYKSESGNENGLIITCAGRTFYQWVRSTSADHTSCPLAFVFYSCLIAGIDNQIFSGPRQIYVAEDLCRHLATMCRQYNDYGSVTRDRLEKNLNSINFPEFHDFQNDKAENLAQQEERRKTDLMWIAEYERAGIKSALAALRREGVSNGAMEHLQVFVNVTDLYGQIYVQRDIGVRTK